MSESAIRAQIATILESVSGIGEVHQYQRWAATWEKFLSFFKDDNDLINGWCISRFKIIESNSSTSHNLVTYHFKIRGYYGLKDEDETEITFQALIDAIGAAFRAAYKLNDSADDNSPIQAEVIDARLFGSVLCHYCELTLTAGEWLAWS